MHTVPLIVIACNSSAHKRVFTVVRGWLQFFAVGPQFFPCSDLFWLTLPPVHFMKSSIWNQKTQESYEFKGVRFQRNMIKEFWWKTISFQKVARTLKVTVLPQQLGGEGRREIKNNNWSTFAEIGENTRHNKLVNQWQCWKHETKSIGRSHPSLSLKEKHRYCHHQIHVHNVLQDISFNVFGFH